MPEYLVCNLPYSNTVKSIFPVVGETEKYWKVEVRKEDKATELIDKKTLRGRGSDVQYYAWTKEQVTAFLKRKRLLNAVKEIKFDSLSDEQLEKIVKIADK